MLSIICAVVHQQETKLATNPGLVLTKKEIKYLGMPLGWADQPHSLDNIKLAPSEFAVVSWIVRRPNTRTVLINPVWMVDSKRKISLVSPQPSTYNWQANIIASTAGGKKLAQIPGYGLIPKKFYPDFVENPVIAIVTKSKGQYKLLRILPRVERKPLRLNLKPLPLVNPRVGYEIMNHESTQFRGKLYLPALNIPIRVAPNCSWISLADRFTDPAAGLLLPYYGEASPAEVNDDINAVWNAVKSLRHSPGTANEISKLIQSRVDHVISSKDIAITQAHEDVLRYTGCVVYAITNIRQGEMSFGDSEKLGLWNKNAQMDLPECQKLASDMWFHHPYMAGVCGQNVYTVNELAKAAGLQVHDQTVRLYTPGTDATSFAHNDGDNHALSELQVQSRHDALLGVTRGQYGSRPARIYSNINWSAVEQRKAGDAGLRRIKVLPYPHWLLAGAKGDDSALQWTAIHWVKEAWVNWTREKTTVIPSAWFVDTKSKNFFADYKNQIDSMRKVGTPLLESVNEQILAGK